MSSGIGPSRPLVIAHRGASETAPEHTGVAYALAVAQGADCIEVDVRLSADGVVFCLHDDTLERVAGDPRRVREVRSTELSRMDVGAWFDRAHPDRRGPRFAGQRPVTLDTFLGWLRDETPGLRAHIELKDPGREAGQLEDRVVGLLAQHGLTGGAVVVEGFEHDALRRVAAALPDVPIGLLWIRSTTELSRGLVPAGIDVSGPNVYALLANPAHVDGAHRRGVEVHVWTVDEEDELEAVIDVGVDGVVTNRPAVARRLVARRADPAGRRER